MNKKMYNAPEIAVVEVETASMIASSVKYNEQSDDVDFSDAGSVETGNAGAARVASNQYFDSWSDDEE